MNTQHTTAAAGAASRRLCVAAMLCGMLLASTTAGALEPLGLMRGFDQGHLLLTTSQRCIVFDIYIARSRQQRAQGLMYVEHMERHEGMLFVYPGSEVIRMWMKNTNIPLDMLFATGDGRIAHIHRDARPHDTSIISSVETVSFVLELNAGSADQFDIRTGDTMRLLPGRALAPTGQAGAASAQITL